MTDIVTVVAAITFFLFNKKLFIFTNLCGNVHKIKIHVNENLHESV